VCVCVCVCVRVCGGRFRGLGTHSAILVLIFLDDVVDRVQQLFDGAGYVSKKPTRKKSLQHRNNQRGVCMYVSL